ncbi:GIY-YIG nuclease family protein [Caproiciproducens faecalis]|uniref:GIY-YIG nuclease family protein n=1 Tax=Caproiciproducens faecalis TaxID=2820301 RepID=A0ABS7DLU1_9FIRM|nr:GIY-YIG nuclease family protein [Caproiciproducens faecalis]MBW7571790.1 GIY-YIG nuclease family protein [Caproiciproducens faecalis]
MDKQNKKELAAAYKERKITGGVYAIVNEETGKMLLQSSYDLQGSKNRFSFSRQTGSCVNLKLRDDWKKYGINAFHFEILEELTKKETQTQAEFEMDLDTLYELWTEKLAEKELY